jgi:hypothetical protein
LLLAVRSAAVLLAPFGLPGLPRAGDLRVVAGAMRPVLVGRRLLVLEVRFGMIGSSDGNRKPGHKFPSRRQS